jgi:NAD(P)-dependent dehydrogenase (short-subunit alcohol dehydrogenase family)
VDYRFSEKIMLKQKARADPALAKIENSRSKRVSNKIDLSGKIAVVTGGAQGIGRAVVERFLASGARVAIWDRDEALARKTAGELKSQGTVLAVKVDLTSLAEVERARDETIAVFSQVDILVNNAGIAGPNGKTWEYDPAAWAQVMSINVDSQFFTCRTLVPGMIAQNYGRIVNVASIAGKEGNPNAAAYSASKAAVIALTKSLGKELAGYDIAVNCVTPAAAKTAIFDQMKQEHIDFMLSKIPRNRFVKVEEVAAIIAFCASSDCSFTTGAVFDVSGGRATY